jgi:hypothetical protein
MEGWVKVRHSTSSRDWAPREDTLPTSGAENHTYFPCINLFNLLNYFFFTVCLPSLWSRIMAEVLHIFSEQLWIAQNT